MQTIRTLPILLVLCALALPARANQSDDARLAYERAQEMLQKDRFRSAEREFEKLVAEYPKDQYAAQAMYWRAFALYRLGDEDDDRRDLNEARAQLRMLLDSAAKDAPAGDARTLMARIEGKLAQLGDRDAARDVNTRAKDDDEELQMAALNALINMDSDRALPILKKILNNPDDYSESIRENAIFLISQHADDDEAAELLVEVAKGDQSPELRENAIFWLSQVDGEKSIDTLAEILREEESPSLQEKAVFAISQHDSPRSAEILREVAIDERYDVEVRANAIFWLGQQSRANVDFLLELYDKVDSRELKDKILFAASQRPGKAQAEFLERVLQNEGEDPELRGQALFWLGQSGMLDIPGLMKLYAEMEDDELRGQAIFAISQRRGPEAADALIQIVRTEKDSELRQGALFWLGQMDDDRAAALLEEIIEGGNR